MSMQGSIQRICSQMANQRTFLLGRSVNLQPTAGLKRAALEKLGLPPKPLRPLSPYFRFLGQLRPSLVKSYPDLKLTALSKIAGVEWLKLDAQKKSQYETPYKKEWETYLQAMNKYKSSLTDEHKMKIKEATVELKEDKIKKGLKKQKQELGKPKKFLSPYLLYLQDNDSKRGTVSPQVWRSKMGESWTNLSVAEKAKFEARSSKLRDEYNESLKKWEDKMIRMGNLALVRSSVLQAKQAKAVASTRATVATGKRSSKQ